MIQSYYRLVYRILSVRNLRFLKFASSSVSHKLRFASICFCPQATLYFAYRLRHPHIVAVLRFVAYSGSFHFTLRKFRLLKFLCARCCRSCHFVRPHFTLAYRILFVRNFASWKFLSYSCHSLAIAVARYASASPCSTSPNFRKKKGHFSVPNNSECKRKLFHYPSCFKVS